MYIVIPLPTDGEGHTLVTLGGTAVELVTRFNYTVGAWCMDILDATGANLITGLALLPGFDLLLPYADLKAELGGMMLVESTPGDHQYPDRLGYTVQLLWFPVGAMVIYP